MRERRTRKLVYKMYLRGGREVRETLPRRPLLALAQALRADDSRHRNPQKFIVVTVSAEFENNSRRFRVASYRSNRASGAGGEEGGVRRREPFRGTASVVPSPVPLPPSLNLAPTFAPGRKETSDVAFRYGRSPFPFGRARDRFAVPSATHSARLSPRRNTPKERYRPSTVILSRRRQILWSVAAVRRCRKIVGVVRVPRKSEELLWISRGDFGELAGSS